MVARDKAIEVARAKKEAKEKKAEGSSKRPGPGAGKPIEKLYSGEIARKGAASSGSSKKRPAPRESSPPPAKKLTAAEKGKAPVTEKAKLESPGSAKIIRGPLPLHKLKDDEVDRIFEIPDFEEPERNEISLFENLGHPAGFEAFCSTLFPADASMANEWKTHNILRIFGHLSVMANNLAFELAVRAHETQKVGRELKRENTELKKSGSQERVKALEAELEKVKAEKRAQDKELSEAENQITALVSDKSRLEELAEKERRESLDAFRRGEEKGKKVASEAKDAEFRKALPAIRIQAVEEFVRGPVFTRSTLLVGANDVDSGWNRALGQVRALGATFDESKLDKGLDENLQPFAEEEDDEDAFPDIDGHEFESILDIVDEMVDRAREKQEAAGARRAEAGAIVTQVAIEEPPRVEEGGPPAEEAREEQASTSKTIE